MKKCDTGNDLKKVDAVVRTSQKWASRALQETHQQKEPLATERQSVRGAKEAKVRDVNIHGDALMRSFQHARLNSDDKVNKSKFVSARSRDSHGRGN